MPVKCSWNSMFSDELWISRRDIVSASASSAPFSLLNRTFPESNGAIAETCAQEDNNLLLLIWFTLMTRNNNSAHSAWASTQLQNYLEVCFVGWSQFYTWVVEASRNGLLVATRICIFFVFELHVGMWYSNWFFVKEKILNLLQTMWQRQSTLDTLIGKCCTGFIFSLQICQPLNQPGTTHMYIRFRNEMVNYYQIVEMQLR